MPGIGGYVGGPGNPGDVYLSGAVGSGEIASGSVQGFFGTTRHIASGTVGQMDFGSGAVSSGHIASGQLGRFHIASGQLAGFELGSGAVVSGRIASGQIGQGHYASGSVAGLIGGGFTVASGTFGPNDLGSGSVLSGHIASGQLGRYHFNSGTVIDFLACEQDISGVIAVAWGSGACFVVPAERKSGLRVPAIGVVAGNFASGAIVPVVRQGIVHATASGAIASGFLGGHLYLGSGGLIINQSGYMEGSSSGHGAAPTDALSGYSGALVQSLGISVSGGIDIHLKDLRSGLLSGLGSQY